MEGRQMKKSILSAILASTVFLTGAGFPGEKATDGVAVSTGDETYSKSTVTTYDIGRFAYKTVDEILQERAEKERAEQEYKAQQLKRSQELLEERIRKEEARKQEELRIAREAEQKRLAEIKRKNELAKQAEVAKRQAQQKKQPVTSGGQSMGSFNTSHYTAFCPEGCTGKTATGLDVSNTIYTPDGYRVVAVDPRYIPLGTIIRITYSDGTTIVAKAADTGGAIKGMKLDVLVASEAEANRLGRVSTTVSIVK